MLQYRYGDDQYTSVFAQFTEKYEALKEMILKILHYDTRILKILIHGLQLAALKIR
jgi:hypothetical protein